MQTTKMQMTKMQVLAGRSCIKVKQRVAQKAMARALYPELSAAHSLILRSSSSRETSSMWVLSAH